MEPIVIVNGVASDRIPVADRGLQFGDGLFETMLCVDGVAVDFVLHWQRLLAGCTALGISCPPIDGRLQALAASAADARCVLKVIVTRGPSARGYRPPVDASPNWVASLTMAPAIPHGAHAYGVAVTRCRTRASREDPRLAGIKHLNRLPQVLARGEWQDEFHDGIMLDCDGSVLEGTASNIFLVKDGRLSTPDLSRGGVSGIVRKRVIERARHAGIPHEICDIRPERLETADEIFLTNSVFGVLPVGRIDARPYRIGPMTLALALAVSAGHAHKAPSPPNISKDMHA